MNFFNGACCYFLQYMHERHVLHRDLKTQNIFLTKSNIIKVSHVINYYIVKLEISLSVDRVLSWII